MVLHTHGRGAKTHSLVEIFTLGAVFAGLLCHPTLALAFQANGFPLAGTWSGTSHNGDFAMSITVVVETACQVGDPCGTFDISTLPCSGVFTLVGEDQGIYEFHADDQRGNCGAGRDFLQLLPDGTLLYSSRGDYGETNGILVQQYLAATATLQPPTLPVIYDDDGSPDGTTALFYLLSDPSVSVEAVIISYGEAHPPIYIQHIGRLLDSFGIDNLPLGAGNDVSIANHDFPEWLRQSGNTYWGLPLPTQQNTDPVQNAARLIVSTLNAAPEPMTIFVSGPCTDLAEALRLDPGIKAHIAAVYIMGGAVYVRGNLSDLLPDPSNTAAEWNIYGNPQAAQEVFESGVPLYLIPLDATNQVKITKADTAQWRDGGRIAAAASDMYDMLLKTSDEMAIWDVMTAEIMSQPDLCRFQPLHLEVITAEGDTFGQTVVVSNQRANVNVCLEPDAARITQRLVDVFSASG